MIKIIFAAALAMTSIASACKISRAGMSHAVMTAVSEYTFNQMSSNSVIKAIYNDMGTQYIAEMLDEKDVCTTQMYDAHFDTLNCKPQVLPVATLLPILCK